MCLLPKPALIVSIVVINVYQVLGVDPKEHSLVTTAPLFAPTVLNETMDQVVFEEFGFRSYARVNAAEMCVLSYSEHCRQRHLANTSISSSIIENDPVAVALEANPVKKRRRTKAAVETASVAVPDVGLEVPFTFDASSCQLVVDSGFSFTHVVPVIDGRAYLRGVKRINVGGKLLTNYLKEVVSFRQWNVMDDTRVINELKEALCYVSLDFDEEMHKFHLGSRKDRKHWVLPDFVNSFEGKLRSEESGMNLQNGSDEQALELGVELISVPEVLFNPSDIGLGQAGVAEAIQQAVAMCPEELHSALYANILLVGGNTKFAHFRERLERELRPLVPMEYALEIHAPTE